MEERRPTFLCYCKGTRSSSSPEIPPLKHDRNTNRETRPHVTPPAEDCGLTCSHGELVFTFYDDIQLNGSANTTYVNGATLSGDVPMSETSESLSSPVIVSSPTTTQKGPRGPVKQDAVDDFLDNQDGKIPRKRDPKMCKHGEKGMCDYCMPLEVLTPTLSQRPSTKD